MLSFGLPLVADAYPLICPFASSAISPGASRHAVEPGSWFSITIGLSAARAGIAGAMTADATRASTAATATRLCIHAPDARAAEHCRPRSVISKRTVGLFAGRNYPVIHVMRLMFI